MEGSEDGAKQVIEEYANLMLEKGYIEGEPPYYLHNMYFDAKATWENGLGGIYSLDEILAVEKFRDMPVPQSEALGNAGAADGDFNAKIREGGYKARDLDADNWINDTNQYIESMTVREIHTALKARNHTLWNKGFPDWNRHQEIWPKKKAGRKAANAVKKAS